jgi:hypothetical protein
MQYQNYKNTLQQLAQKIGDIEQEMEEHKYVKASIFFFRPRPKQQPVECLRISLLSTPLPTFREFPKPGFLVQAGFTAISTSPSSMTSCGSAAASAMP